MRTAHDELFVDANLLQAARGKCEQRLAQEPDNVDVLRSLGEIYRKLGMLGEAAGVFDRLHQLNPNDREANYVRCILNGLRCDDVPTGTRATPYYLIRNFLPAEVHAELIPYLASVQDNMVVSPVGFHQQYKPDVRNSLQLSIPWIGRPQFKKRLLEVVDEALTRMYLPAFEMGELSIMPRAYLDGHFFRVHSDVSPQGLGAYRRVNFVYYFHRQPRAYSGGELLLYDTDIDANTYTSSRFTLFAQEDNSIIFFPCAYYHSVIPVRVPSQRFEDSRFIVNGFLSTPVPPDVTS